MEHDNNHVPWTVIAIDISHCCDVIAVHLVLLLFLELNDCCTMTTITIQAKETKSPFGAGRCG